MVDNISIGTVPVNEECAQFGQAGYKAQALKECQSYIKQLKSMFGAEQPESAQFKLTTNPYEGGIYYDVVVEYTDQLGEDFALNVESNLPESWSIEIEANQTKAPYYVSAEDLGEDAIDYMCSSVVPACCSEGCQVEPDGKCSHGFNSILVDEGIM